MTKEMFDLVYRVGAGIRGWDAYALWVARFSIQETLQTFRPETAYEFCFRDLLRASHTILDRALTDRQARAQLWGEG